MLTLDFIQTVAILTTLGVGVYYLGNKMWERSALRARWNAQECAQRIRGTR